MKTFRIQDHNSYTFSDNEIVERVLLGEKALYEILVRRNNQKLFRVLRGYLKNEMDVKDAMQETYLKAFEKLFQFNHEAEFSTWLIRIGINEALARLNAFKKNFKLIDHSQSVSTLNASKADVIQELNPERKMIQKEAVAFLEKAIDELKPKYRAPFIMQETEGMNVKEISECLGISVSNTKVRLHRARTMIKDHLFDLSIDQEILEFGFSKCDTITEKVMGIILADR
ncbi:MAG: sigma-70 family RNA polymerase sigma factor [Balneola sp.]